MARPHKQKSEITEKILQLPTTITFSEEEFAPEKLSDYIWKNQGVFFIDDKKYILIEIEREK